MRRILRWCAAGIKILLIEYNGIIMKNRTKVLTLLLVMLVLPAVGYGQNNPQKEAKKDSVKQTVTVVPIHESLTAELAPSMVGNDTILSSIQDTLNQIASITTRNAEKRFLGAESDTANNRISLLAMLFGFGAAVFALLGFIYQRKSAISLQNIETKRLPYMLFARNIFDNILTLDILADIENDEVDEDEKNERRNGYQVDKAIEGLRMPDDLIDIKCYERFEDNNIYAKAMELKVSWRSYNKYVDELLRYYNNKDYNNLIVLYGKLRKKTISLLQELADFENLINGMVMSEEDVRVYGKIDVETFESEETIVERLKTGNRVPNTPNGAKKIFLHQLILDSYYGQEQRNLKLCLEKRMMEKNPMSEKTYKATNWRFPLIDSRLFKYDTESLGFDMNIFIPQNVSKIPTNRMLIKGKDVRRNPEQTNKLLELLQHIQTLWECAQTGEGNWFYEQICFDDKRNDLFAVYSFAIAEYASKVWSRAEPLPVNKYGTFLLRVIYNMEIGLRRKRMIEDTSFFDKESYRFLKEFYRYQSIPIHYGFADQNGITLKQLICSVVAEQSLSFNLMELCFDMECNSHGLVLLEPLGLAPTLEKIGVIKNDSIVVATEDVLEELLQKVQNQDILNERVDTSEFSERYIKLNDQMTQVNITQS